MDCKQRNLSPINLSAWFSGIEHLENELLLNTARTRLLATAWILGIYSVPLRHSGLLIQATRNLSSNTEFSVRHVVSSSSLAKREAVQLATKTPELRTTWEISQPIALKQHTSIMEKPGPPQLGMKCRLSPSRSSGEGPPFTVNNPTSAVAISMWFLYLVQPLEVCFISLPPRR